MEPFQVLLVAAAMLEKPGAWSQGLLGRNSDGRQLSFEELPFAKCWCLSGAIMVASGGVLAGFLGRTLHWRALAILERYLGVDPVEWNDKLERTQAEVVEALRCAARMAEAA